MIRNGWKWGAIVCAAIACAGWTWDSANAGTRIEATKGQSAACHGNGQRACTVEAAAAAAATLTVTADSTTFTASGCQAGERATIHVTYNTADGATYEVSGYTSANADGNINATFPSGSAAAEAATGSTYTGATLTGQCGDLTFEAKA